MHLWRVYVLSGGGGSVLPKKMSFAVFLAFSINNSGETVRCIKHDKEKQVPKGFNRCVLIREYYETNLHIVVIFLEDAQFAPL